MTMDGNGGAIVVWSDARNGAYDWWSDPWNLDVFAARIGPTGNVDVPRPPAVAFRLFPARPNPTRSETSIPFELAAGGPIDIDIFSVTGQRVCALAHARDFESGRHELIWSGFDDAGKRAPPGIYLVRLAVGRQAITARITLLR